MRAVCGSTVLYPCDANQTAQLVKQMIDLPGVSFLRTTREKTPILYRPGKVFPIGGSTVVKRSDKDQAVVVGAGITVHEALKAYEQLISAGITVRIIDAYSVKPIDRSTLNSAAKEADGRIVVVEDHWFEGGLGDAVLDAFVDADVKPTVVKLAVSKMPGSGTPAELMHAAGIDAAAIVAAVRRML